MSTIETTEAVQATASEHEPLRMSYEQWLAWEYSSGLTEWVDGEVIIMSPPSIDHQRVIQVVMFLLEMLEQVLQNGKLVIAPVAMRLHASGPVREPDLLYVLNEHLDRFSARQLDGPADLVVEVISDDSVARDRIDKFYEYQAGGVREYWIIDPREQTRRIDLYHRDPDGRYQPVPPEVGGIYRSKVVSGFWLRESWLWQEDPDTLAFAAEVVGVEQMLAAIRQRVTKQG
jgi:Uma2 family endonuclease